MKLYDGGRAPNPRRVRIFFAEKGIPLPELVPIDIARKEHRTEAFTRLNPLQRLPVLERAVTLVRGEPVTRIVAVERLHHPVALGLGDDRRARDREVDAVALVERVLRHVDARHGARVDEEVLRRARQRAPRIFCG